MVGTRNGVKQKRWSTIPLSDIFLFHYVTKTILLHITQNSHKIFSLPHWSVPLLNLTSYKTQHNTNPFSLHIKLTLCLSLSVAGVEEHDMISQKLLGFCTNLASDFDWNVNYSLGFRFFCLLFNPIYLSILQSSTPRDLCCASDS